MSWLLLALGSAQAGMSLQVASMTVDGLQVRALSCNLDGGGLLASAMVVGSLAAQKPALDKCAPSGAAFGVQWTWAGGGSTAKVDKASDAKASACVVAALEKTQAAIPGTCSAVVLVGDPAAAARAADAL